MKHRKADHGGLGVLFDNRMGLMISFHWRYYGMLSSRAGRANLVWHYGVPGFMLSIFDSLAQIFGRAAVSRNARPLLVFNN
jgi:hypothetical protein